MNPNRTSVKQLLVGAVAAIFLALPAAAQGPQELLQQGMAAYNQGDYDTARAKFREILAADPSNAQALELLNQSEDALLELLIAGGEWEVFAAEILAAAGTASQEVMRDPEAANAAAEDVFSDDFATRQQAIFALGQKFGPFGAPPLVRELGSDQESRRLAAIYGLSRMGSRLFLPVITAAFSDDAQTRMGALQVLNEMNDMRAAAVIADLAANDPDGAVRALADMVRMSGSADVAALHVEQAEFYIARDLQRGLAPAENYGVLWTTEGRNLIPYEVPSSVIGLEIAKFHLLRAAELGNQEANGLLARVYSEQVMALMATEGAEDAAPAQYHALLSLPHAVLNDALGLALEEDNVAVSTVLADALTTYSGKTWSSLTAALDSNAVSVRVRAANGLANARDFSPAVVAGLAEGIALKATRVVHMVDPDRARGDAMAAALEAEGVIVVRASSGPDAIVNMHLGLAIDAFIVADPIAGMTAKRLVGKIRGDGRFDSTPVFVIGDDQTSVDDAEVVDTLDAATVLGSFGDLGINREEDAATAASCAAALVQAAEAGMATPAVEAMMAQLGREDAVAAPCCTALGLTGQAIVAPALVDVLADSGRSDEVRFAAARALTVLHFQAEVAIDAAVVAGALDGAEGELASAISGLIGAINGGHVPAAVVME